MLIEEVVDNWNSRFLFFIFYSQGRDIGIK